MIDKDATHSQLNLLRSGYRPSDSEATSWNVAHSIDPLRSQIVDEDLAWIFPAITESRGVQAAFYIALLKPLATKSSVREFLVQRFETSDSYLKSQLLWRIADDPALPVSIHDALFAFVMSNWSLFQDSCVVGYLGNPSQVLQAALGRLADCPVTKQWLYLCCLPQYADDQLAVRGVLNIAASSTQEFTANVARALVHRFFNQG
jgi:hypothetical protein